MKRFLSCFAIGLCFASYAENGSEPACLPDKEEAVDTQIKTLNFLDEVEFKVPGCVIIQQGTKNDYRIVAEDDALRKIKVSQSSGNLILEPKLLQIGPKNLKPITLYVTAKNLQKVTLKGDCNCDLRGIKVAKLTMNTHGDSHVKGDLLVEELNIKSHGNAVFNLKGNAKEQNITMHGSSKYDSSKLSSNLVEINIHGNAKAKVKASQELIVTISGNGTVSYGGNPKVVKKNIKGNGTIRKL